MDHCPSWREESSECQQSRAEWVSREQCSELTGIKLVFFPFLVPSAVLSSLLSYHEHFPHDRHVKEVLLTSLLRDKAKERIWPWPKVKQLVSVEWV